MARVLAAGATRVGKGTVGGRLFDLGPYPGAVPGGAPDERIRGELYRLGAPSILVRLDDYEGCGTADPEPHLFRRDRTDVTLDGGGTVRAWIYWYARSTHDASLVSSGDYLNRG